MKRQRNDEIISVNDQALATVTALKLLNDPVARSAPCFLCGGEPYLVGVFIPNPAVAKRIGQRDGKRRMVGYTICRNCYEDPTSQDRLEEDIIRDLEVQ